MVLKNSLFNRFISLLSAFFIFCFSSLSGFAVFAEGEGIAAVITISTPHDLASLTKNCVYDSYSKNMQVTLLNNIDMTGVDFEPMKIFCGTFEGGGHYITGIKLDFDGSQKALCYELGDSGEIRNLNVSGEIKSKQTTDGATSINEIIGSVAKNAGINTSLTESDTSVSILGGIVGKNQGKIINCSFDGIVEGENIVGGIVGQNEENGYIESCYNVSSVLGKKNVGGIAGKNYGWISSSKNSGSVNSSPVEESHNIGGICGLNDGVVENCLNDAEIGYKNVGTNIGGIAGNQSGCILESQNIGSILGDKSIGGIFGRFEPYTDIRIEDLDRVKDDIDDIRENIRDDINNTWDNTIDDINDFRDKLNTDVNDILDRFGIGGGLLSGINGLSEVRLSLADAIDLVSGSQSGVLDAIRDRINSGEGGTLEGIRDDLGQLTDSGTRLIDDLNSETRVSLDEAISSINDTINTANEVSGTLDTLIGDIDSLVVDINDSYNKQDWDSLGDRLDSLDDRLDYMQDEVLYPVSRSLTTTLTSVTRAMNALRNDSNDIASSITKPFAEAEKILKDAQAQVDAINNKINQAKADIKAAIEKINEHIKGALPTSRPSIIGSALSSILFMTAYADEQLILNEEDLKNELNSITSVDLDLPRTISGRNTDDALVMYCFNSGFVSGQKDLGGIGGTIGIESAVKYGNNITLQSGKVITPTSIIKAVVNGCISEGEVESRNGYAGGVVGNADFGIIKNTITETNVSCDDGNYIGGIAGYSGGKIYNCGAISDLSGTQYVGGIAGMGDIIATCYALPRMKSGIEKSGAITGTADGIVLNNYFIKEGLSGIDGADFDGKAVALDYTEITGSDIIPEKMLGFYDSTWYMGSGDIFLPQNRVLCENDAGYIGALLKAKSAEYAAFHFKVSFVIDDNTVYETVVDYNTVLDQNVVPDLEFRDGYCPQWSRDTTEPIRRNTVFKAEYIDAVKTISTDEVPPLLLVEGNFRDGAAVTAREVDTNGGFPSGYRTVASYEFEITPDYNGKMRVHIRDQEGKGNYIGLIVNGKTEILETERDGSYLVFETGQQGTFTILHKPGDMWFVFGILLLAAGLLLIIGVVAWKRLRKDELNSDNDNNDDENKNKPNPKKDRAEDRRTKREAKAKAREEIKEIKRRTKEELKRK